MTQLAARCPACDTLFRVVPDQLRVSDGWVRCGRCAEVFDANETLVDLDTGRSAWPPAAAAPAPEPAPEAAPPEPQRDPSGIEFDLQIAPSQPISERAAEPTPALPPDGNAGAEPSLSAPDLRATPQDLPSFVRQAERAEVWRQPRVRAALALLALLGVLALAAQAVFEYRSLLAARHPALRPLLEQACAPLGCQVGPVHAIDSLVVESSGLVRVEKSSLYKLQVVLRNRSDLAVALPALDLSLSDGQGRPLARRVLRLGELGVNQDTLAAGRELALQATLQAAGDPVSGYTLELFYP